MSNSIAAAKRRRAGVIEQPPPAPTSTPTESGQIPARLSLPQIIAMLDARLVKLERSASTAPTSTSVPAEAEGGVSISEYVVEMDHKFSVLVEEITNLKDVVMKLQAYTMDVNKMLVEERINIMSEFQPTKNLIRPADSHSSWSMTDKEINPSPEGAVLNLQGCKVPEKKSDEVIETVEISENM